MTQTSTRGRHAAPARTPIAVLAKAASMPSNRRGAMVFASSGLIITMAATTASATTESSLEATPLAGEASVSDTAVAALSLAPAVTVSSDVKFDSVDLEASSQPAPVIVQVSRTTSSRTTAAASSGSSGTTAAAAQTYTAAPVSTTGGAVGIARQFIGTPYLYGGATPAGFDCSGFTQYVFRQLGINLPRSSSQQRYAGTVVSAADARPGDLVWWPGHVGIYTGGGNHIAARNPGKPLQETPMYRSNPTYIRVG